MDNKLNIFLGIAGVIVVGAVIAIAATSGGRSHDISKKVSKAVENTMNTAIDKVRGCGEKLTDSLK